MPAGKLYKKPGVGMKQRDTYAMRSKEEADDYRYFPDPDLVPVIVESSWVEALRQSLPEMPDARQKNM